MDTIIEVKRSVSQLEALFVQQPEPEEEEIILQSAGIEMDRYDRVYIDSCKWFV